MGEDGQTLVYPAEIRESLRKRFPPEDGQKAHDDQYDEKNPKVKKFLIGNTN